MIEHLIMNTWDDLFSVFLYGGGGWLGLIVIMSIIVLVVYKVKLSGMLFMVVSIFIGITYLENVAVNSNLMWCAIMMFLTALYCIFLTIYAVYEKRG